MIASVAKEDLAVATGSKPETFAQLIYLVVDMPSSALRSHVSVPNDGSGAGGQFERGAVAEYPHPQATRAHYGPERIPGMGVRMHQCVPLTDPPSFLITRHQIIESIRSVSSPPICRSRSQNPVRLFAC